MLPLISQVPLPPLDWLTPQFLTATGIGLVGAILGITNHFRTRNRDKEDLKEKRYTRGPLFKAADISWDYSLMDHLCSLNPMIKKGLLPGREIHMDLVSTNPEPDEIKLTLDGKPLDFERCVDSSGGYRIRISYYFDREKEGELQTLKVNYRSKGFHDTQTYDLVHGQWYIRRLDPE